MDLLRLLPWAGFLLACLSISVAIHTATLVLRKDEYALAKQYVQRKRDGLPVTTEMRQARLEVLVQRACRFGFLSGVGLSLAIAVP
jgi:hypothetical protein